MTHKTFGTRDAMRQHTHIIREHRKETRRKASITVAAHVPPEDIIPLLKMLGLEKP